MLNEVDLEQMHKRAIRAADAVKAACSMRKGQLRMSIPAREDDDDVLVHNALMDTTRMVKEYQDLKAKLGAGTDDAQGNTREASAGT